MWRATADSYIVRIYRREKSDPERMVGVVEDVQKGHVRSFNSTGELLMILGAGSCIAHKPGVRASAPEAARSRKVRNKK